MDDQDVKSPPPSLRPDDTIQKLLISTTSRFIAEFDEPHILVAHAWPAYGTRSPIPRSLEGPASRNAFMAVVRTEPYEKAAGVIVPDYSWVGDVLCELLAVLYGKRFDSHGPTEGTGHFNVPDTSHFETLCDHRLPFNSHKVRADAPIPLDLREFKRLVPLLLEGWENIEFRQRFSTASRFYLRAIQASSLDPEIAYLHLITAGEVISNHFDYGDDLLDEQAKADLNTISELPNGASVARRVRATMRQIKRKFLNTLINLIDDSFFDRTEASDQFLALKKDDFRANLSAAYDLRSRYVHTGERFGKWIEVRGGSLEEVSLGRPVGPPVDLVKILEKAPTFIGLERITRYALLRFAAANGLPIFDDLTPPTLTETGNP